MCNPIALAVAAVGTGMYLQDRSLRKSIKSATNYQSRENERQLGYENQAREVLDTATDTFQKDTVDDAIAANAGALGEMLAQGGQPIRNDLLPTSRSNNQIVNEVAAEVMQDAADDNIAKANLQASLDSFGQTLTDANPKLQDSIMAANYAGNFARGSLGALAPELQHAQSKAYSPLGQLMQTAGTAYLTGQLIGSPGGAQPTAVPAPTTPVTVRPLPPLP